MMPNPIRRRLGAGQMNNQVEEDPMMMDQGMDPGMGGGGMEPMPNPIRGALDSPMMEGGAMPVHDSQQFKRSYGMPQPKQFEGRGLDNSDPTQDPNPWHGDLHARQHESGNAMRRAGTLAAKRAQITTQKQRFQVMLRQARSEAEASKIQSAIQMADQALVDLERAMGAYGGESMPEQMPPQ